MRNYVFLLLVIFSASAHSQPKQLTDYKKYFDKELKPWVKTFPGFKLDDLTFSEKMDFIDSYPKDIKEYKKFISVYKPLLEYSPDSSRFIDLYSYQLGLTKKKNYYEANIEVDQAVYLFDRKRKYWKQIYFGTIGRWIDEVTWISDTKFILAGIVKNDEFKNQPQVLLGDTDTQVLYQYTIKTKAVDQNDDGYHSPKLKRMKIKDL